MRVVRGGIVVTEQGLLRADIGIEDGRIVAVGEGLTGELLFDATGLHVFPGFLDPHVHGCDEGLADWEDFSTLTAAALAGGITALLDMPLNDPPTTTAAALRTRSAVVAAGARCDVGLWAGAVPGNAGEIEAMVAAGAHAIKAFMVETPGWERCDDGDMLEAMREAARLGVPLGVHAESQSLVAFGEARELATGRRDVAAHATAHDEHAEAEAIHRALLFAGWAGCRLHVVHVAAHEALEWLAQSPSAHGEGAISLLCLDAADRDRLGVRARIAPPIRQRDTVDALWRALVDGTLEWVGSDHSPYPPELKAGDDVWTVPDGAPSIETCFPLLLSEGVHRRGLSLARFATLSSAAAARAYGLWPRKGALLPDRSDADLALVDLDARWRVEPAALHHKHPWSLHEGAEITGRVVATIRRGDLAYAEGELLAPPGSGHVL
ncbi:MAG: allantoinase [Solirubrobacteraceae bacterium]